MSTPTQPAAVGTARAERGAAALPGPTWLPSDLTGGTFALAIASLASQIGIIVTGAAVRLTGSGLGCPTWPRCTAETWTNTPEMGIHGFIEFGNRTLTFVLSAIAVAMLLWVLRLRHSHRQVFGFSVALLAGIAVQAGLGGITVLTGLNPWTVSIHYLVSAVLVGLASLLVDRVRTERRWRRHADVGPALVDGQTTAWSRGLSWVVLAAGALALALGTVVTGTGPHGGDPAAPRLDLDPLTVTKLHVVPVYVLTAATVALLVLLYRVAASSLQRRSVGWLLVIIAFQAAVGYYQHLNGLPVLAVILHLLGSGLLAMAVVMAWDRQVSGYRARPVTGVDYGPEQMAAAVTGGASEN